MNTMRLPKLTHCEAKTISDLVEIKQEYRERCAILAGGTDLIPRLKRRSVPTRHLVSIKGVLELSKISREDGGGLRVGAGVTLRDLIDHPLISKSYPLLARAALSVATNQLRNMGTLGGNVCLDNKCPHDSQSELWWKARASCFKREGDTCYVAQGGRRCVSRSAADTVPALMALDAEVIVVGPQGERRTPIGDFYTGDGWRSHRMNGDEFMAGVLLPPDDGGWSDGFMKKSPRGSIDFSIASLAIRVKMKGGRAEDVRIALNGISTRPVRATEAEHHLIGERVNHETIVACAPLVVKAGRPVSLIGASPLYRRTVIEVMFTDLVQSLAA
jgi:4-hydroxybenzoyl-CoA reductase subunit beta